MEDYRRAKIMEQNGMLYLIPQDMQHSFLEYAKTMSPEAFDKEYYFYNSSRRNLYVREFLIDQKPDADPPSGLTKREYFAAMALQGFISGRSMPNTVSEFNARLTMFCEDSVRYADTLIKKLEEMK